ncbi:MAG TPA: hypothetical protein VHK28_00410 [Candidatus Limnocylindria bacterium]|nr:hypothetical protein [Candidatus Limnocylindria bacterium]
MLVLVAGCGLLEPAPRLVAVPTGAPPPLLGHGCPAALLEGQLVADDEWGVAVATEFGPQPVRWPNGFYAEREEVLVLRDRRGNQVAAEGEVVYVGGGMDAANEMFVACDHVSTEPPG